MNEDYESFKNSIEHDDFVKFANSIISDREARKMGRLLRLATVQGYFNRGELTEQDARELLKGNLTPDDDSTFIDDSDRLETNIKLIDKDYPFGPDGLKTRGIEND